MSKHGLSSLALFGGPPAFSHALHVGRPNIGDRDALLARIEGILDRRWLTNNGPVVQEFERGIERITGAKHAIAMCNATVALEVAIRASGMTGEVIVPSFTFVATAHALQWQGITPVFCDIDPQTYTLDPARIEALITRRTTGIIGVHVFGVPCAVEALAEMARSHGLRLIYDAAHAFGVTARGRMVGTFGDAEVFSSHATKFVNSFEGGAVTTNDDGLAARIRSMRNFGFAGVDNVEGIGTNGKMSEVSAAMGLTSLESMGDFVAVNRRNYRAYAAGLSGIPGVALHCYDEYERHNYQYIVVEVDADRAGIDRDTLVRVLQAENVLARRYFYPGCHQMEPYRTLAPDAWKHLPETERLTGRVMTLPTGTDINAGDVAGICELIRYAVRNSAGIRAMLESVKNGGRMDTDDNYPTDANIDYRQNSDIAHRSNAAHVLINGAN